MHYKQAFSILFMSLQMRNRIDYWRSGLSRLILSLATLCCVGGQLCRADFERIRLPGFIQPTIAFSPQAVPIPSNPLNAAAWSIPPANAAPIKNNSGLELIVDNSWPAAAGYRPIRLTLTRLPNSGVAERELTIQLRWRGGRYYSPGEISVRQTVALPEKVNEVTADVFVPWMENWETLEIQTVEAGAAIPELSAQNLNTSNNNRGWQALHEIKLFLALSDFQQTNATNAQNSNYQANNLLAFHPAGHIPANLAAGQSGNDICFFSTQYWNQNLGTWLQSPADLPKHWLGYSTISAVFARPGDLQTLETQYPQQAAVLRAWLAAGGMLLVCEELADAPTPQNDPLAAIDRWLNGKLSEAESSGGSHSSAWNMFDPTFTISILNPQTIAYSSVEWNIMPEEFKRAHRSWQGGRVVFCSVPPQGPGWVPQVDVAFFSDLSHQFGKSFTQGNPQFFDFLIPGVGAAPVTAFQILLTLFVIVIGPVNYFWLRKRHRLSWMLVTVPVSALVVSGLLLVYGLLSDGFDVRLRARSATYLDQTAKTAVTQARLSYYAGFAPRDGLRFSAKSTIYPIVLTNYSNRRNQNATSRTVDWENPVAGDNDDRSQRLVSGWFNSRTPTQYVTTTAVRSTREVRFSESQGKLTVKNLLGTKIQALAVCDERGNFHYIQDLAADNVAELRSVNAADITTTMYQYHDAARLEAPSALTPFSGSSRSSRSQPQTATFQSSIDSPLEITIARALNYSPSPRTYFAVIDEWPDLEIGVTSATREGGCFHVVIGKW